MLLVVIAFTILLLTGMPVAFAIGISGCVFFLQHPELPSTIPIQLTITETQNFALLAVPLFILAGNFMNNSGITQQLLQLATVLTGRLYGGLAQVSIALSTLMSGVTGSSIADAAMNSRLLGAEMLKRGFSKGYAASVLSFGSLMAPIIPPGIGFILYGTVGQVSIGRLFAAGIVPGLMLWAALALGGDRDRDRERGPEHQSRQDARGEEAPDRYLADGAIENEADAGRDDRRQQRAVGEHARRVSRRETALQHLGTEDPRIHRRVGDRRAGDAAHQRRQRDRRLRETALQAAGEHRCKLEQVARDPGIVEEVAREDEQGHREQCEVLRLGDGELDRNRRRQLGVLHEEHASGDADRERDGHAHQQQHREDDDHQQHLFDSRCPPWMRTPRHAVR